MNTHLMNPVLFWRMIVTKDPVRTRSTTVTIAKMAVSIH